MGKQITVTPSELESVAGKISQWTTDYRNFVKELYGEIDAMSKAWQGADNLAYTNQVKGFEEDFQAMANLMNQYEDFLRKSAKAYRDTQNEIKTQAGSLTN
jgi:WXG100 family type VII secretion target